MKQTNTKWIEDLLRYRKANFAVEIVRHPITRIHKDEVQLNVTHNGNQWSGFTLMPDEMDAVVAILQKHIAKRRKPSV